MNGCRKSTWQALGHFIVYDEVDVLAGIAKTAVHVGTKAFQLICYIHTKSILPPA